MYCKPVYEPILPRSEDWPVVKLFKKRSAFLRKVVNKAIQDLSVLRQDATTLRQELSESLAYEQDCISASSWRVDLSNKAAFWQQAIEALRHEEIELNVILQQIMMCYAQEIAGGFSKWHYQLAQTTASYTLDRLLTRTGPRSSRGASQIADRLHTQIQIEGPIQHIRQLAHQGTIVMVPTHISHFDSVLIWWVIHTLGLPPFIYGAGLNLFNRQFFAYFMNKLGTYKVDRRKKNIAYLTTLKAYSVLALQRGCHSLFYPGGTRSRSGSLESTLKLGLLGAAVEAQQSNYQMHGPSAQKLFVVPVVLSYHSVLEAPHLIRNHLAEEGIQVKKCEASHQLNTPPYRLLRLIRNLSIKNVSAVVSFGQPLDVLGQPVDTAGRTYDATGAVVDTCTHFRKCYVGDAIDTEQLREDTKQLGKAIVQSYRKHHWILASHWVAFVSFTMWQKQHTHMQLGDFWGLSPEVLAIPYTIFERICSQVRAVLIAKCSAGELQLDIHLREDEVADAIVHGIENLGIHHMQRPLLKNHEGDIITQDLYTLFYYHNKLVGYGLEEACQLAR
ncbi:MAG: 1-acyl-sn-glycerol-3-phosphate acyltransferase [Bacteroidota bacterium]